MKIIIIKMEASTKNILKENLTNETISYFEKL